MISDKFTAMKKWGVFNMVTRVTMLGGFHVYVLSLHGVFEKRVCLEMVMFGYGPITQHFYWKF